MGPRTSMANPSQQNVKLDGPEVKSGGNGPTGQYL